MKLYNRYDIWSGEPFTIRTERWSDMIKELQKLGLFVDSAYKREPERHILAYYNADPDDCWLLEVTQYFNGDYEIFSGNMRRWYD